MLPYPTIELREPSASGSRPARRTAVERMPIPRAFPKWAKRPTHERPEPPSGRREDIRGGARPTALHNPTTVFPDVKSLNRFPDHSVAGLGNAVAAYLDGAREARRLASIPTTVVDPLAAVVMRETLVGFAELLERKAANLEAKIAELASVEGEA